MFQNKSGSLSSILLLVLLGGCSLFRGSTEEEENTSEVAEEEELVISPTDTPRTEEEKEEVVTRPVYRASETRRHDLVHTVLDVSFDLEKRQLFGEAEIDVTPHFYPSDSLTLDAKGFAVHEVTLVTDTGQKVLPYHYDKRELHIGFDSTYTREDTFRVYIDYTAKPEELEVEGSDAIADAQGLYFIDPDEEDPNKPTQIWTQGETEASSCWFPTIDAPNQKMTQEISITVNKRFKTLSNGELQYSIENGDGTRTDHWKQDLPHVPYLAMMAIGDFAVVEDEWQGIPVNYWVEKDYEDDAMAVFKNTPEMIGFYSELLGFEYPWAKYDQVVVRDFVSGAMENTTAVVHGSMQRQTTRELIDGDNEPTIAHELIHHWFGNIVTCESWANLPLNESFATYGEYLWEEYKYGRDAADKILQDKLKTYLQQARQKQVDMIRYDYADKEDMFDAFSYHKGGCILHMLRNHVGDKAFFASLEEFLHDNAYEPVEIHDLRLAFEEVTGEDLNWFFDQWFLDKGHPKLGIDYEYENGIQHVIITQDQDLDEWPLYKLPMKVDLYFGEEKERHSISLEASKDTFSFSVDRRPDLVNVDAEKMLLCEKTDRKPNSAYIHQYKHAPLYLDRYEAVSHCSNTRDSLSAGVLLQAMGDAHYRIRRLAVRNLDPVFRFYPEKAREKLLKAAKEDRNSRVRATALSQLDRYLEDEDHSEHYERALEDSSYLNVATALRKIAEKDPERGQELAEKFEDSESSNVIMAVAEVYKDGGPEKNSFFLERSDRLVGLQGMGLMMTYGDYLKGQPEEVLREGLPLLEKAATGANHWYPQFMAARAILELRSYTRSEAKKAEDELEKFKEIEEDEELTLSEQEKEEREQMKEELRRLEGKLSLINESIGKLREEIENERVRRFLGN